MFIRLTDGRVAYTDDASFFFILTEPVFRTLIDSISGLAGASADVSKRKGIG
jgi:hypothetical protein